MNAKVLAGIAGLAFAVPAPAVAATTRYVSPNGAGMICGPGSPCPYDTAYGNSFDGDTIVFAAGDYTFASTLRVEKRLTLEGAAGGPVPHLVITARGSSDGI